MFVLDSTLTSGAEDAAPSSEVDSDDFETISVSSQYTLELDSAILDSLAPLTRVGGRRLLQATKPASDTEERGSDLFWLYRDDEEEAEDSLEDDEVFSEGSFGNYDNELVSSDESEDEMPQFDNSQSFEGAGNDSESGEDQWEEQTEVPFSRNQSWEHVWKPTTSDVQAGPLFVRSHLDNLIGQVKLVHFEDSQCESAFDLTSLPDDFRATHVLSSSNAARMAVLLNTGEYRRDPWNISLPTEVLFDDEPQQHHSLSVVDCSVQNESTNLITLVRRSWGDTENAYYRAWNNPPLSTVRDCFDIVQQLLEGAVFFHELGLSHIPFSASNIVMDIGLAPCPAPWRRADTKKDQLPTTTEIPWDRATYPVKYYLASLDGLQFVSLEGPDGNDEEYTRDLVNLGTLVKDLFSSVPGNPFEKLYDFMLLPAAANKPSPPASSSSRSEEDASTRVDSVSSSRLPSTIVHPTASSSLELLRVIEATYKNIAFTPLHKGGGGSGYSQARQAAIDNKHVLDEAHGIGVGGLAHDKG